MIARRLVLPLSTIRCVVHCLGCCRVNSLNQPAWVRSQRQRPGELVDMDIKKFGRIFGIRHRITGRSSCIVNRHLGIGWEYLHGAVADTSRLAYAARRAGPTICLEGLDRLYGRLLGRRAA